MTGLPMPRPTPALTIDGSAAGYESPSEDNQLPFFTPQPSPSRLSRPALLSRPSHVVAITPDHEFSSASQETQYSLNDVMSKADKVGGTRKISIKDRIACYKWTYFTMTMATGGIANVLYSLRFRAEWINGIGIFFFLLNLCLFIMNCVLISMRFYIRPGSFMASFTDPVECLFIPAFFVSLGTIFINICEYGIPSSGPWLLRTMEIMFWIYVGLSMIASCTMYLILWSTLVFPVHMMTPTWVFPAYPLLLTAPFAANLIAAAQRTPYMLSINSTAVAFCAATTQGTGCLIAFMISAAFLYRLMTQKLPRDMQRPGVFISIGPFGFTAAGIAQLGSQSDIYIPEDFLDGTPQVVPIIKVISLLVGLWLWGLSMWFFLVSVGSLWKYIRPGHSIPFQMTWWSFVFPNTALVTATEVIGAIFDSKGIQLFGSVMTCALIITWIGVFITMLHALKHKKLLYPKNNV